MNQASITVKYYNAPNGNRPASVKDAAGTYYSIPKELEGRLQPNTSYEVLYDTVEKNGKTYYNIKSLARNAANGNGAAPAAASGTPKQDFYRPTSPVDAERMFVCATLGAYINAGQLPLGEGEIVDAIHVLRNAWVQTFGANGAALPPAQPRRMSNGPGDEMPWTA